MTPRSRPRVVVPYTRLHPALEPALRQQGVDDAEYVRLTHETAYWELLCRLWDGGNGDDFIFVEHDIIPWAGAIQELWDCPEPWCSMPYKIFGRYVHSGFGCTKFGKELIRFRPDGPENFEDHTWRKLDMQMIQSGLPWLPHPHSPPVLHMNAGSWGVFGEIEGDLEGWIKHEARRLEVLLRENPEYRDAYVRWTMGFPSDAPLSAREQTRRDAH